MNQQQDREKAIQAYQAIRAGRVAGVKLPTVIRVGSITFIN